MHFHNLTPWQHAHDFGTHAERIAEQRTRWVTLLTLVAMIVELAAGWLTGSMALLADGWHMGSHAAALGISTFAYSFARQKSEDRRFTFGTGKVPTLSGYSSALLLAGGAGWMLVESVERLLEPVPIRYGDAIAVAAFGLAVNLVSAAMLGRGDHGHSHGHDHGHDHAHAHARGDHNLRAAYFHVLADALTSVLALAALGLGMVFGWVFLDPIMGIVGGILVGSWSWGLAKESARVLLDAEDHGDTADRIKAVIEGDGDNQVADLHLWRVGSAARACIVSIVTHDPRPVDHYKKLLERVPDIAHLTVEVNQCRGTACATPPGAEEPPSRPSESGHGSVLGTDS